MACYLTTTADATKFHLRWAMHNKSSDEKRDAQVPDPRVPRPCLAVFARQGGDFDFAIQASMRVEQAFRPA